MAGVSKAGQQDIEQLILIDRVNRLYASTGSSIISLLTAAAIYLYLQLAQQDWRWLLSWYGVLCVTLLGRILLSRAYNKNPSRLDSLPRWLLFYRLSILSSCLTLGSISFLFSDGGMGTYQLLTILVLLGITSGALAVLSDFVSQAIYIVILMGPVAGISAIQGGELHLGISVLILILMVVFLRFAKNFNDSLTASLRLRYENQALLADLQKEKSKIDNRLGRILNDSSNEVYVLNADSLLCLQVNAGAIRNLGYTQDELHQVRLPEILEMDEQAFQALIEPLSANQKDLIFFRGHHLRKDGSVYPVEVRLQLSNQETPPIIVATALDITEREEYERRLTDQANFDQLTGLPNRHFMLSHIDRGLSRARRNGKMLALIYMDLDNFKNINDSLGHSAGDELLKQAAGRIRTVLREADTPARLGGDEFLVLLDGMEKPEYVETVTDKLVQAFKKPFLLDSRQVYSTTSVGISIYPGDGDSVETLMQNADTAMYQAKAGGRSHYRFFSEDMRQAAEERMLIASHLRRALDKQELSLVYQPLMDIDQGSVVGAEALLRWRNPELGQVPPDQFIPVAESLGLIEDIGDFVLRAACEEAAEWNKLTPEIRYISVNVSSQQFRNGDLLASVDEALQISGLSAEALLLEITESLLIQDSNKPLEIVNALRARNIRLALDDFGTGYSSLSYLKRFPLQVLKIDRSFINDLGKDGNDDVLVEAIIAMAKSLNLDVVGEGVETKEQLGFLRQRGVKLIQGYYFSPPIRAEEFREMLRREAVRPALVVAG